MNRITSFIALLAATVLGGCASVPSTVAPSSSPEKAVSSPTLRSEARAPRIVQGDLDITNRTSLEAFADVEVVTGTLTIIGNTRLSSLDGLEHLRAVRNLVITENLALANIEGLSGLRHARNVTIGDNPRLENLHGLESLRSVDRLIVSKNGIFCSAGLSGLTAAGEIVIDSNPRLLSLQGLENLESAGNVTIRNNPRLSAASGLLDGLNSVSGRLTIEKNAGLRASELGELKGRVVQPEEVASL